MNNYQRLWSGSEKWDESFNCFGSMTAANIYSTALLSETREMLKAIFPRELADDCHTL
jgi:hypothetical protein